MTADRIERLEAEVARLKTELAAAREGLQWYRDANTEALRWYTGGDTGISSETIFEVMTGIPVKRRDVPYDPDDFGRCHRLLKIFPLWKSRLHEVAERFPKWKPLIDNWDQLESLYVSKDETMYEYMRGLMAR